ncbi:sulfite exporter TauE/SafE family protein [Tsukamurella sp. 8F]|uniref:sulfite exporter TauE/SafE family protein n=1 Tax=unclassified Tsukamurella TaxID=2633480 RepID=UPI0023BA0418|nr:MULTISPECIES: sulfite exporter TauE/SafE family protein [unclassified Tsukamurella]MDF0530762.1 sulfite exporter TauE/SafE family protein [Tsukamurella sp. 8J]MDF0587963.1 sulfite exporter TauE/SafE family protein [Tsukamurella sp. 8F]
MSIVDLLLVAVAGFGAGLVGFVTGLASIVSYPALLAVGIPPVAANVTNTVAMVAIGVGSTTQAASQVAKERRGLAQQVVLCALGGVVGAAVLLLAPASSFEAAVPALIAIAALALLLQPSLRARAGDRTFPVAYPIGLFIVSIYGGYFGAGAGVMMLALMLVATDQSVWRASVLRSFLLAVANLVAAIGFALWGPVHWPAAIAMSIGAYAGGYCGPPVVARVHPRVLRIGVAVCGFGLAAWLALR